LPFELMLSPEMQSSLHFSHSATSPMFAFGV
jgi:hypothetical protein